MMKTLILAMALSYAATGLSYKSDENKKGFQLSESLSHSALAEGSDKYPKGEIINTISVSGYTYFQFKQNDKVHWAASSVMDLKKVITSY